MNWRDFKPTPESIKGFKVIPPTTYSPLKPIKPLIPVKVLLEIEGPATEPELLQLIGEVMAEIDKEGRPWTGWRVGLTPDQRQRLKELERRIDETYAILDRPELVAALTEYRRFCLGKKEFAGITS